MIIKANKMIRADNHIYVVSNKIAGTDLRYVKDIIIGRPGYKIYRLSVEDLRRLFHVKKREKFIIED